jgi:Notch-like protein
MCIEGIALYAGSYSCYCEDGYGGNNCADDIDECWSTPCLNSGTCEESGTPANVPLDEYTCTCRTGFEGAHCETDINECANFECLNGGTCVDLAGYAVCDCAAGYCCRDRNSHCEVNLDECASAPCGSKKCVDLVDAYKCVEKGCDGVWDSQKQIDACDVCGGDNSTCVGCDGIPQINPVQNDVCGVCGGGKRH